MPLQIRRGTNAERLAMTLPLAQGELLYVTDDQRLYIGNGTTTGGVQITGYTDGDAKDAAAASILAGTHSGITFSYNTTLNELSASVDLSTYNGSINVTAVKGSVFADDSTLLVDGVDGTFNLDGTVKGSIVPNADAVYDIGSSSYKFKDLYLSGNSIHLGNALITSTGSVVNLPAGSTINGVVIGTGDVITSSIDSADSSAITVIPPVVFNTLVTVQDEIHTPSLLVTELLTVQGDLTNSYITVRNNSLYNPSVSTNTKIKLDQNFNIEGKMFDAGSGLETTASVNVLVSSTASNLKILENGPLYAQAVKTHNGVEFVDSAAIAFTTSGTVTTGASTVPVTMNVYVGDGTNDLTSGAGHFTFNNTGSFSAPIIQTGVYTSTPETRPTGVKGMIVFNDTTSKFQGFDGSAWVDLN